MPETRLTYLLHRYFDNKVTEEENDELMALLTNNNNEEEVMAAMDLAWKEYQATDPVFPADKSRSMLAGMIKLRSLSASVETKRKWRWRYAVAAVLLVGAVAVYSLVSKNNKNEQEKEIAKDNTIQKDIAPGGNKAVLTLANGSQIILDSAANGDLASQGNVKVIKLDGQLAYNSSGNSTEVLFNTITTPRGGQYQLVLADGSKVWLNAESSLRFPASFVGNERRVELTGEGYFEVAKNASMPFKVKINTPLGEGGEIEVLGTHFNINSYSDEATINTTLLEGKVKVSALNNQQPVTSNQHLLSPGQQAQQDPNGQISLNKNPNLGQVMAWKNGLFNFDNSDLQMVLRQLARWYDVKVQFEGAVPQQKFEGEMQRDLKLSQVLRILEKNNVRFKIEGKTLIVRS